MRKLGMFLATFVALFLAIGTVSADTAWWNNGWQYRKQITVDNLASSTMETGYTVNVYAGLTILVAEGKAKSDLSDVRVVWHDPSTGDSIELDRLIDGDDVLFKIQTDIPASGSDGNYYIYYGNPSAGTPPADGGNVYLFYDDFENGLGKWTYSAGVSIETSSDNSVLKLYRTASGSERLETLDTLSLDNSYEVNYEEISYSYGNDISGCTSLYVYTQKDASNNFYMFEDGDCDRSPGWYDDSLRRYNNNVGTRLARFVWVHSTGVWRDYTDRRAGNVLEYIVNGATVASAVDPSPLTNDGKIMIYATSGSGASLDRRIDNFRVSTYISPRPMTSLGPEETTDSDNDGVPDSEDACPDTEEGAVVNADGCSIAQLCPADAGYKNHGAYVSCVAKTAEAFLDEGLITEEEKDATVSAAAKSDIGKKTR